MQRRALSPLGVKRQRVGRKALATARVFDSIERKLPVGAVPIGKSGPKRLFALFTSYQFRKWHAYVLLCLVAIGIVGNFLYSQLQYARAEDAKRQTDAKQKIEAASAEKRQECYKSIVAADPSRVNTLTYDQLYGTKCNQ